MSDPIYVEGPDDADWIKTIAWDLPTDFRDLMLFLCPDPDLRKQKAALSKLMALDCWTPAPAMIKRQAATFLAGTTPVV